MVLWHDPGFADGPTLSVQTGAVRDWPGIQHILAGHTDAVWSVMFLPNGKHIFSGSLDQTIRVECRDGEHCDRPV
jgi:WD40 repeat protein